MGYFVLKIEISKLFNIYLKTHHMKLWSIGQISPSEKSDIMGLHKKIYDGYQTMQSKMSDNIPLYIQDFANDKEGLVVNNKGDVKAYTNFGINEMSETKEVCDECGSMEMEEYETCNECGSDMYEEESCNECGGALYEGVCSECGYKSGNVMEMEETDENIYKERDLNNKNHFEYISQKESKEYDEFMEYDVMESAWEDDIDEVDVSGSQGIYGSMKKPYVHPFEGPDGPYQTFSNESDISDLDEEEFEDDEWEKLDEELYESFMVQKKNINEMMHRMKVIKI